MSENLLDSILFQRGSVSTKEQVHSGTIPGNGGSAIVASITIPIAGYYLLQATGWNYGDPSHRFTSGHIALVYNEVTTISQQGLDDFTFNIMGYSYLTKDMIVKLVYTNWDDLVINLNTMSIENFTFKAIRIG